MDDARITSLYWNRDEAAISQTQEKYGRYLHTIAYNILSNKEDSEECVGDTYLRVWSAIPTDRPSIFQAYIGKIVRNLSLNRYAKRKAQRRGGGEIELLLDELNDCIPAAASAEMQFELSAITAALNSFLAALDDESRALFVRRYWYVQSIKQLQAFSGYSESKLKSILFRLRNKLKIHLEQEGVEL